MIGKEYMRFKEQIRDANPIEEIASQYTQLSKDGAGRLKGLCPFHQERDGSFTVYQETQSWYCFGCRRGGDVFDLVMLKERMAIGGRVREPRP